MPGPRLTVALPTRNRRDSALAALAALVSQLEPGDELLVVDNGSSDGTGEAVGARLAEIFPAGRVVHEGRGGLSAARNTALSNATAPIVCFVDDDVRPAPGWLAALRRAWADAAPRVAVVGGPMRAVWQAPRPAWLADDLLYVVAVLDLGGPRRRLDATGRSFVWGGNLSVRVDAARAVGGFDVRLGLRPEAPFDRGEEEDLQRRLAAAGWEIWYEPAACVDHLVPPERLAKSFFSTVFRERGRGEARRGRSRAAALAPLIGSAARCAVLAALRRPQAAGARFRFGYAWALLTAPRAPGRRSLPDNLL